MRATPENSVAVCEYSNCGKTFVRKDTRLKHCSDSCRVQKSRMKSRERELQAMGSIPESPPTPSGAGVLTDAQFKDLKESILLQLKQEKPKETASTSALDLMHVVESGLGYMAGKAVVGMMGKSSVEQKLDYLIHLLQHSLQGRVGMDVASKPTAINSMGMGTPTSKPVVPLSNTIPKGLQPKIMVPKPTSSGMSIPMPQENAKSNTPTNPFSKDGLMM